jgi:hypothetical protein
MKHLSLIFVAVLFVVGCASSKKSENNNNTINNINNTTGPCSTYCTAPKVCIGSTDANSTCASPCPCESPKVCYSGGCVDLFSDPNNCGAVGNYCSGTCTNGTCVDACAAIGAPCQANQTCCDVGVGVFACRTTGTDMLNCGSCGRACSSTGANACLNGQCACGSGAECTGGRTCCSNSCKDTNNDVYNCGSCGNACGVGLTCSGGQCMCGSAVCGFGESCCGNYCANLTTEITNCGECGNNCGTGNGCAGGNCTCGSSGQSCRGTFDCGLIPMGMCTATEECCAGGCAVTKVADLMGMTTVQPSGSHCGACGNSCNGNACCCVGDPLGGGTQCSCCAAGQTCGMGGCQ